MAAAVAADIWLISVSQLYQVGAMPSPLGQVETAEQTAHRHRRAEMEHRGERQNSVLLFQLQVEAVEKAQHKIAAEMVATVGLAGPVG